MNKIEEFLMKVSRVFGAVVLGITLIVILGTTVFMMKDFIVKVSEKTVPQVKFYKSDFVKEKEALQGAVIRPDEPNVIYAKKATDGMKSSFEKTMNDYIKKYEEKLTPEKSIKWNEIKADYISKANEEFLSNSEKTISYLLRERFSEKYYESYVSGLLEYFKNAELAGVEVYSAAGDPFSSIKNSQVFWKYTEEFNDQYRELINKNSKGGLESIISNAALFVVMFFSIGIFLVVSVMFAIIRIEKKMK